MPDENQTPIPVAKEPDPSGPPGAAQMKTLGLFVGAGLASIVFLLPLAAFAGNAKNPLPKLDVKVSKPSLNGNQPTGDFTIFPSATGIHSDQTGGACLLADIANLAPADKQKWVKTGKCTLDKDCNPSGNKGPVDGYCAPDKPGGKNSRCWYKPTNDPINDKKVCQESLFGQGSWPIGKKNSVPFMTGFDISAFYTEYTGQKPTRWRLVGRVNHVAGDGYKKPLTFGQPACLPEGKCK